MKKIIDSKKVSEELLEVLAKNEITVDFIDSIFKTTKDLACHRTIVQKQ